MLQHVPTFQSAFKGAGFLDQFFFYNGTPLPNRLIQINPTDPSAAPGLTSADC